jgi:hypothetical protein
VKAAVRCVEGGVLGGACLPQRYGAWQAPGSDRAWQGTAAVHGPQPQCAFELSPF